MSRPALSIAGLLSLGCALVGLLACGSTDDPLVSVVMPDPSSQAEAIEDPEQLTVENATLVRDALELWSEGAWHHYPWYLNQPNVLGQSLIDLLPDGQLLVNSFTGQRTEPRMDHVETPGTIHYANSQYSEGGAIDYTVEAYGLAAPIWSHSSEEFDAWGELESRTHVHGVITQIAVEDWTRERGGIYPGTLTQVNQAGHSVIDFLPEGRLMVNPFTLAATEPDPNVRGGSAARPGQVGYAPVSQGGTNTGYTISMFGRRSDLPHLRTYPGIFEEEERYPWSIRREVLGPELVTLRNAIAVRRAVRRWSEENGGGYPPDLAATNLLGHNLVDLLLGGFRLRNPFTGSRTEPRFGSASGPGEVSYMWVTKLGEDPSFRIEAFGESMPLWSWEPRGN